MLAVPEMLCVQVQGKEDESRLTKAASGVSAFIPTCRAGASAHVLKHLHCVSDWHVSTHTVVYHVCHLLLPPCLLDLGPNNIWHVDIVRTCASAVAMTRYDFMQL